MMRGFMKQAVPILIFFSAVSLAYSQTTDEGKRGSGASQEATDFFGNGPQSPSQSLPEPLTRREINNQTVVDGEVDGDKNPELIPEYMLWGMFLSKIHMHRTPRDVPSSGILSPEIQKLVETVGLSPDQLETLTAIASECTARAEENRAKFTSYREQMEKQYGKRIHELPAAAKDSYKQEALRSFEDYVAIPIRSKEEVLQLLDAEQQRRLNEYLLRTVARGIKLAPIPGYRR